MRSRIVFIMAAGLLSVTIATHSVGLIGQGRQGPGIQAPADAREKMQEAATSPSALG